MWIERKTTNWQIKNCIFYHLLKKRLSENVDQYFNPPRELVSEGGGASCRKASDGWDWEQFVCLLKKARLVIFIEIPNMHIQ